MKTILEQACHDILSKNLNRTTEMIYCLYDTESPLARIMHKAYVSILPKDAKIREFHSPPQPLYRWGLVNPENPHIEKQHRVITDHNIAENKDFWLNHYEVFDVKTEEELAHEAEIESVKNELISLPPGSIVVLIQSTNFRLSTFRIRLELFHRGIHVIEHNHLAYIPEEQFSTFISALQYRTPEYKKLEQAFSQAFSQADTVMIESVGGSRLTFGPLEPIRGNTGDYSSVENKWWTFPIGEVFTEAIDLSSVSWKCLVDTYPREDFSVEICEPFELVIENGRVLPSPYFPPGFQKLYDWVVQYEGEVMVRELWFGLNPAISTATPLRDINFHERKLGVHLSLGKKHGIYGKKLPKTEVQRFHIDVFIALNSVYVGQKNIFSNGKWII
jgi:aminopeptidase